MSEQTVSGDKQRVSGPFCRIGWHPINLNSSDQVKKYLLSVGWQPTEWNYKEDKNGRPVYNLDGEKIKTSPKLTEDSFDSVQGDVPSLVARRNILVHRKRMLKNTRRDGEETGWLNQLRSDGRIEARGIPLATNTGRYRHSNVVNVPAIDAVYGADIRSLFTASSGLRLVGVDASALEARIQGHYVYPFRGGKALAELLIEGDIHQANADLWGVDRKGAKSPYYCLMYGGQPPKLAETMGCSLQDAQEYYDMFWGTYTPLAEFRDTITQVWKQRGGKKDGYLKGLDGRKLFARSQHALVNMMFQSGGSIVVKLATVLTDRWVRKYNIRSWQVLHMHDEFQRETHPDDVEKVKALSCKAFEEAGKYFNMNVPIIGEAKVGLNWRDTH